MERVKAMIGKKVIVRADRAGVFFGTLAEKDGTEVVLTKCRRLVVLGWRGIFKSIGGGRNKKSRKLQIYENSI